MEAKGGGAPAECLWRSTADPKSQRTYYYHKVTKETRWDKPDEMCGTEELAEKLRKRSETANFFKAMEKTIKDKVETGWKLEIETNTRKELGGEDDDGDMIRQFLDLDLGAVSPRKLSPTSSSQNFRVKRSSSTSTASRFVRTFSSMDDEMLEMLKKSTNGKSASRGREYKATSDIMSGSPSMDYSIGFGLSSGSTDDKDSSSPRERQRSNSYDSDSKDSSGRVSISSNRGGQSPDGIPMGGRQRRNSTGTIYVDETMSQQDDEATIKAVCRVIRAHMLDAAREGVAPLKEYDVFKDRDYYKRVSSTRNSLSSPTNIDDRQHSPSFGARDSLSSLPSSPGKSVSFSPLARGGDEKGYWGDGYSPSPSPGGMSIDEELKVPQIEVVVGFFKQIYKKSQLESECIIMSLIYLERLIKDTRGRLCIRYDNWKPILFACLVMSSKVWDDMSMWNADFSQISPSYNLTRINELELAMLDALKFTIRVSAGEYAKYYFLLRSMIAKLGLHKHGPNYTKPLDIQGARKLQLATEKFDTDTDKNITRIRRCATMAALNHSLVARTTSDDGFGGDMYSLKKIVGLEQLIHTEHVDADGRSRTLRKKEKDSGCLDGELEAFAPKDMRAVASHK